MSALSGQFDRFTDAIFEIREAVKCCTPPSELDGTRPIGHHTLLYMDHGSGKLAVNGRAMDIERDCVYVYAPGASLALHIASDADAELCVITFDLFRIAARTDMQRTYERVTELPAEGRFPLSGNKLKRLIYLLVTEGTDIGDKERFLCQQYLHDLLDGIMVRAESAKPELTEDRLKRTIDYMQLHYREDIRVDMLSQLAQLHPSYYSQLFKQTMDKTPLAYLTHLRMNKAKEMLLQTDKQVRDIAADVGYADEFYFSRRFKEANGYPPSVYVKKTDMNIISLSYPYTDHLVTLGLHPVAAQTHPYIPATLRNLALPQHASESWEFERQLYMDLQPDLILCKDNILPRARPYMNDIAPIISIPWNSKDVFDHHRTIAELTNRQQAAQQWIDEHRRQSERVHRKIRMTAGGATVAICAVRHNGLRMYTDRNIGHVLYRSLQLAMPERLRQWIAGKQAAIGYNWLAITPDELGGFEADYLFFVVDSDHDRRLVLNWQRTNAAWMRHPAIRSRNVYFLDWSKWIVYAPIGLQRQLEEAEYIWSRSSALLDYV